MRCEEVEEIEQSIDALEMFIWCLFETNTAVYFNKMITCKILLLDKILMDQLIH